MRYGRREEEDATRHRETHEDRRGPNADGRNRVSKEHAGCGNVLIWTPDRISPHDSRPSKRDRNDRKQKGGEDEREHVCESLLGLVEDCFELEERGDRSRSETRSLEPELPVKRKNRRGRRAAGG